MPSSNNVTVTPFSLSFKTSSAQHVTPRTPADQQFLVVQKHMTNTRCKIGTVRMMLGYLQLQLFRVKSVYVRQRAAAHCLAFSEQPIPSPHISFVQCTFTVHFNNLLVNFRRTNIFIIKKNFNTDHTEQVERLSIFIFILNAYSERWKKIMTPCYAIPGLPFTFRGRVNFTGSGRVTWAAATRYLIFVSWTRLVCLLPLIRATQFRTFDKVFEALHEDKPFTVRSNRHTFRSWRKRCA